MAKVPVDPAAVDACRASAADVADEVQRFIDRHTTVGVERLTNPFLTGAYPLG